jgi:hypothetical protein
MLEKRTREVETITGETKVEEFFVETIVETKEVERNEDQLESQITQKENTILELQNEVSKLKEKQTLILAFKQRK